MAKNNATELRAKSINELNNVLQKEKGILKDLRFRLAGAQLKSVHEIENAKRTIARILTIIKEKSRL